MFKYKKLYREAQEEIEKLRRREAVLRQDRDAKISLQAGLLKSERETVEQLYKINEEYKQAIIHISNVIENLNIIP